MCSVGSFSRARPRPARAASPRQFPPRSCRTPARHSRPSTADTAGTAAVGSAVG